MPGPPDSGHPSASSGDPAAARSRRARCTTMRTIVLACALAWTVSQATRVVLEDGSVRQFKTTTRKYLGRRHVELDVTGARLTHITEKYCALDPDTRFEGAVVVVEVVALQCDAHLYSTLAKSGALAVITLTSFHTPGNVYYVPGFDDGTRGEALPWLDMCLTDADALASAFRGSAANITLAATPNPFLRLYRTPGWMVHRALLLLAGVLPGFAALRVFKRRRFTIRGTLRKPTAASAVLLIEMVICPMLGVSFSLGHGGLWATDAIPFWGQFMGLSLFSGWGLFTTKVMAMHWREARHEITTSAPQTNFWTANRTELNISFNMTVGVDTAMGCAFVFGDYVTTFPTYDFAVMVILVHMLAQTYFAVRFLYTAWRLRAEVLLSLHRKLTRESSEKAHIAHLLIWLALSGIAMLVCASTLVLFLGFATSSSTSDQASVTRLVSCWAITYYGRVATSFAQVMSLRVVPNSPVVDEVLFGGSSPSSFRRGRLLPKWLLLSRAVDRSTTSSKSEQGLEEEDHIPVALHETKIMEDYETSDSSSSSRLK